ncbi:unnamed protein product [Enterobius vermicularis]|uniref:Bromo domain-containing protein n=1 Tax=Enterobius vermicularis TaxID=51028 RepID=A0A0N4VPI4_ENTVE|nr:unnamed protein product [Enterobius vermicularis]
MLLAVRELKANSEAALKPKGHILWKKYAESGRTAKTSTSLTSHFRKQMYDHIEDARLPIDRVLYIANALEMDLSRKKKLLEARHDVKLSFNAFNTRATYIKNVETEPEAVRAVPAPDAMQRGGLRKRIREDDVAQTVSSLLMERVGSDSHLTSSEETYAKRCTRSGRVFAKEEKEKIESEDMELSPDAQRLTCSSSSAMNFQNGLFEESDEEQSEEFSKSREEDEFVDRCEADRQRLLAAARKHPGYCYVMEVALDTELDRVIKEAYQEKIPLMDFIGKQIMVLSDELPRLFDLRLRPS